MHTEPYEKSLPVKLTPEELERRRLKQAIETPLALELHGETMGAEESAWKTATKTRAGRKAELEEQGKKLLRAIGDEARVLRAGVELRDVDVEDSIDGGRVVTRRLDTGEEVDARKATPGELREWDERHGVEPARVPGSKTTEPQGPAPGNGHDPEDIDGALDRELPRICAKAHAEEFVFKALGKSVPASTPLSRKAAVERALAAGHLGADASGKLLWAPREPKDDGIVPDDYRPSASAPTH